MSDRPLEPARHDPTAAQAIARADRAAHAPTGRVVYRSTRPAPMITPTGNPTTLEEVIARRNALRASLATIYADLQTCTHHERGILLERKTSIETTLAHLKILAARLHDAQAGTSSPTRQAARGDILAADNPELLYRMYRMFQHHARNDQMPDAHKRFMMGVKELLRERGYSVRKPAHGDPLEGFMETMEAA